MQEVEVTFSCCINTACANVTSNNNYFVHTLLVQREAKPSMRLPCQQPLSKSVGTTQHCSAQHGAASTAQRSAAQDSTAQHQNIETSNGRSLAPLLSHIADAQYAKPSVRSYPVNNPCQGPLHIQHIQLPQGLSDLALLGLKEGLSTGLSELPTLKALLCLLLDA